MRTSGGQRPYWMDIVDGSIKLLGFEGRLNCTSSTYNGFNPVMSPNHTRVSERERERERAFP
jgi:hypothetical protein